MNAWKFLYQRNKFAVRWGSNWFHSHNQNSFYLFSLQTQVQTNTGPNGWSFLSYNFGTMFELLLLWFGAFLRIIHTLRSLVLENLALRQQLTVLKRRHPKPRLGLLDKLFWVALRRLWSGWKKASIWSLLTLCPAGIVLDSGCVGPSSAKREGEWVAEKEFPERSVN